MTRLKTLVLLTVCFLFSYDITAQRDSTANPTLQSGLLYRSQQSLHPLPQPVTARGASTTEAGDCFTWTYKLKTGGGGALTVLQESYTISSGIIYSAGYTTNGSGGVYKGLLQKLDSTGNIAWSKSYGMNNAGLLFNSVRESSDGRLLVSGTVTISGVKRMILAKLDLQGTPIWANVLQGDNYNGSGVTAMPSGAAGFTGYNDTMLVFGVVDVNGTVSWRKEVKALHTINAAWISRFDYDGWYVTGTGKDSSRNAGVIVKVNTNTRNIAWMQKLGGPAANSDFIFHDLEFTNIRPRISGIFSENGGNYRVFNLTVNTTSWLEGMYVYDVPGLAVDTTARTTIAQWAEVIAFSGSATDPDVYAVKMLNDYNSATHWRRKFTGLGIHSLVNTQRCFDGGYIFSNNLIAAATSQGYYVKVDSIGSIKNCEPQDFQVNVSSEGVSGMMMTPAAITTAWLASPVTLTETVLNLPSVAECRSLNCPPPVVIDSCITGFSRKYRSSSLCDLGNSLVVLNDNDILVVGSMRNDPYNASTGNHALVARINKRGELLAKKKTMIGHGSGYISADTLLDGNLLLVASSAYTSPVSTTDTGYWVITKMDRNLNVIWSKALIYYSPYSAFYGIVESADGSLFINFVEDPNFCQKSSLMKLDASGNFLWLKDYTVINACIIGYRGSITQDENHLYIANYASSGSVGSLLMKVRKTDGSVVWSRRMQLNVLVQMEAVTDISFVGNKLVMHGYVSSSSSLPSKWLVHVVDTTGNLVQARYFRIGTQSANFSKLLVTRDQHVVLEGSSTGYARFLKLDSNLNIVQSKRAFTQFNGTRDMKEAADGSFYSVGLFGGASVYEVDLSIKKYNRDGVAGSCAADTMIYDTDIQPMVFTTVLTQVTSRTISLYTVPQTDYAHTLQENQIMCHQPANCNQLTIAAPQGICNNQAHTVTVARNNGCSLPVFFITDDKIQVLARTDSSLSIKAVTAGVSVIKARIFNGCYWVEAEASINITLSQLVLELGPDKVLCSGNTCQLHAGPQFFNYLWNTGSTDSVITINTPGNYYVSATDACGSLYSDTIKIDPAPAVPLNIGSDRVKCNNDTLHLDAPPGFISYSWGPAYHINSFTTQQVIVQPDIDTIYYLKAEKTPGCFGYDTLRVKVNHSPVIHLGNDTSFCSGNNIILDAGPGFQVYQWSTGSNNAQLVVSTKGAFSVIGTDANGCRSYDTLQVEEVWPKPLVMLEKNPGICSGSIRVLQAGTFSSYLWHDGSTASSFTVTGTGVYHVAVANNYGCEAGDTVAVTNLYPLPSQFLPADTAICSFGSLFLSPKNMFTAYAWSTGSNSASIEIKSPGIYSLQVTDANGCMGSDTVEVKPKECLGGLYIPNAFTPNKDGNNDVFKPYAGGVLVSYRMDIYNRFGQLVHSSTDPNSGWDGTINNVPQTAGTYVYFCRYQFQGEPAAHQKGTLLLIR